jgi:ABC-type antimicrobial peptide transport system permease subunit
MITMLTHYWLERNLRIISSFSISLNVDNESLNQQYIFFFRYLLQSTFRIISINTQPVHITTLLTSALLQQVMFSA